jgi:hypothetical protein
VKHDQECDRQEAGELAFHRSLLRQKPVIY